MKKKFMFLCLLFLMFFFSVVSYTEESQIHVSVNVAAMQELTVEEGVAVTFKYPWKGMEDGEPLLFSGVGKINIKSNVDWILDIQSMEMYRDLEIYMGLANSNKWHRVDNLNYLMTGEYGSKNLTWDIKIVKSGLRGQNSGLNNSTGSYSDTRRVNMIFTLTQL